MLIFKKRKMPERRSFEEGNKMIFMLLQAKDSRLPEVRRNKGIFSLTKLEGWEERNDLSFHIPPFGLCGFQNGNRLYLLF